MLCHFTVISITNISEAAEIKSIWGMVYILTRYLYVLEANIWIWKGMFVKIINAKKCQILLQVLF